MGVRITLDPTGPTLDPGEHARGRVRGGSWARVAGGMKSSQSAHGTQTPIPSLGLRVCVDPVQQEGSYRVFRGGSWSNYGRYCRSANRGRDSPAVRNSLLGFRVALEGVSA